MSEALTVIDSLYTRYHKEEYIHPDPLEFLLGYPSVEDREIVGMISSCFALGRVDCILDTVGNILHTLSSPRQALENLDEHDFRELFRGFSYRFFRCDHLVSLLVSLKHCIREFGSIHRCFSTFPGAEDSTYIPALTRFIDYLTAVGDRRQGMLLCSPRKGSACKRHMLFLRWMVRSDCIDPGGWTDLSPARLVVPVDTHMLAMSRKLGFTARNQADLKTALEITEGLKQFSPGDPVKYDFSMTRPGIRGEI